MEKPALGTRPAAISRAAASERANGEGLVSIPGSPGTHIPDRSGVAEALPEPGLAGVCGRRGSEEATTATIVRIERRKPFRIWNPSFPPS